MSGPKSQFEERLESLVDLEAVGLIQKKADPLARSEPAKLVLTRASGIENASGYIGIQAETGIVEFRTIDVEER